MNFKKGNIHIQLKSHWNPEDKSIEDYVYKVGILFRQ